MFLLTSTERDVPNVKMFKLVIFEFKKYAVIVESSKLAVIGI